MLDSSPVMPSENTPAAAVTRQFEQELVDIFSELANIFGNPPSLGAIYGLLFASEAHLSMEEVIERLGISKGSASQGLRQLEELGAITRSKENGDRYQRYSARLELKPLLSGFLSKRLLPSLASGSTRLDRIQTLIPNLEATSQLGATLRLKRLSKWYGRANSFLPLAQRFLQAD